MLGSLVVQLRRVASSRSAALAASRPARGPAGAAGNRAIRNSQIFRFRETPKTVNTPARVTVLRLWRPRPLRERHLLRKAEGPRELQRPGRALSTSTLQVPCTCGTGRDALATLCPQHSHMRSSLPRTGRASPACAFAIGAFALGTFCCVSVEVPSAGRTTGRAWGRATGTVTGTCTAEPITTFGGCCGGGCGGSCCGSCCGICCGGDGRLKKR